MDIQISEDLATDVLVDCLLNETESPGTLSQDEARAITDMALDIVEQLKEASHAKIWVEGDPL